MSDAIITVENVGKKYVLNHASQGQKYIALRDVMASLFKKAFRPRPSTTTPASKEEFWALSDVSFEIKQGEVLGIIGRNGAGKSTLLKLLSRITEPTKGRIILRGRLASLLEVGTGFHPELTGRENIYLNGAILGMSRVEIRTKFDEIVAFAEVERFLDTPVKHYSSGMYVRLAFAVAAHLEPEILVVDEVLAVGDSAFQKKCLGKMRDVASGGRTVLFVSHNLNAIEQLCDSAILLSGGRLQSGPANTEEIISKYLLDANASSQSSEWHKTGDQHNHDVFSPLHLCLRNESGDSLKTELSRTQKAWLEIEADVRTVDPALTVGYDLYDENGILVYRSYHTDTAEHQWPVLRIGRNTLRTELPQWLNEGTYRLDLVGGLHFRQWLFEPGRPVPTLTFTIQGELSQSPYWTTKRPGVIAPIFPWHQNLS